MSFLYIQSTAGITYSVDDQTIFIATGQIVKVEVLSLCLFRIHLNETTSYLFERTELDFFLRYGMFRLITTKDRSKQLSKSVSSSLLFYP